MLETLPEVHNQLRVTGQRLVRDRAATLVRVGPCTDPLDLVLGVLHGVRASGATGSVVVTTPTTAWAERLADRLRRRGVPAAGPDRWGEARGGFPVVVGARAAALAPVPTLACAVVLDAHDDAYRQTQAPCWSAVPLLAERCRREQAALVATSWCPDPSLLAIVSRTETAEHESRMWPRLVVADLRATDPRERLVTSQLADAGASGARRAGRRRARGRRPPAARRRAAARVSQLRLPRGLRAPRPRAARRRPCARLRRGLHRAPEAVRRVRRASAPRGPRGCLVAHHPSGRAARRRRRRGLRGDRGGPRRRQGRRRHRGGALAGAARAARVLRGPRRLPERAPRPRRARRAACHRARGPARRRAGIGRARARARPDALSRDHAAVTAAVRGDPSGLVAHEQAMAAKLSLPPHVAIARAQRRRGPRARRGAPCARRGGHRGGRRVPRRRRDRTDELCDALADVGRGSEPVRVEVDPPGR